MYGIEDVGRNIKEDLSAVLQKNLDDKVVEVISMMLRSEKGGKSFKTHTFSISNLFFYTVHPVKRRKKCKHLHNRGQL